MALDLMNDITTAMKSEIAAELGASYKELAYVENVQKNNFRTGNDRYGVRALQGAQVPGVTKNITITQEYEVVLTKGYIESSVDDTLQVSKSYDNRENLLDIYKRLVNNRAGLPSVVLNVFDLIIGEPEYLEQDKIVIQRATMNITYRFTLI